MKMIEILDKDKDRLLTEMTAAATAEKAIRVLENEVDKLVLRHNENCSSERERDAAAYMMQAVRLSLPLIDSAGRTKVWEHEEGEEASGKVGAPAILLILAGIALCVFGLFPFVIAGLSGAGADTRNYIVTRTASIVAGLIALFLAGYLFNKPRSRRSKQQHVEIRVDADKIYRNFRTAIIAVDQSLDEVGARERWEAREKAGDIDGHKASDPEIELFSDLLAASYSGDPEYALEKIEAIKYFLHKQQIEVVDYSERTAKYFDLMPGIKAGTIRPAMVADGALLKKGLASTGK